MITPPHQPISDKLAIVIPAYNEAENIETVLNQWYSVIERVNKTNNNQESRLFVLNDGSKDNTLEIMQKFASDHPCFIPIDKENSGHGATILEAYKIAINHEADFIFQTDSDGQTDPDEFFQFWELRHSYDAIIGARTQRQDGMSRVFVTKTLKAVIKYRFHVDIQDANTPFRLMSATTLKENIEAIPDGFNLTNVLLSVIYFKKKQRVKFIPISFKPRQGGINSINMKSIYRIGKQAMKDFKQLNNSLNESI